MHQVLLDKGEWSLTVPADFLNADKADRVKSMGSYADAKAQFGRLVELCGEMVSDGVDVVGNPKDVVGVLSSRRERVGLLHICPDPDLGE
jgi:hypothetical protein